MPPRRRRRTEPQLPVEPLSDFSSADEFPDHHRRFLDSDDEGHAHDGHAEDEDEDVMHWSGSSEDDPSGDEEGDDDEAITEDDTEDSIEGDYYDDDFASADDDDDDEEGSDEGMFDGEGSDGEFDDEEDDEEGEGRSKLHRHQHNAERSRQIPELRTIMRRLLRLEELLVDAAARRTPSSTPLSPTVPTIASLKEAQMYLWTRFVRIVADEHRRSSDRYSNTLNFHDRSAFEHLTHTIHRNTKFCELLEAACIVGGPTPTTAPATATTATAAAAAPAPPPGDAQELLPASAASADASAAAQHHQAEGIGKLAQYVTCLISEGTREALLSPLGIAELLPVAMREASRAKRLAALSLIFSMFDQDELSVGDAMAAGLHKVLLQRSRSTVGHMFDLNTIAPPMSSARSGSPTLQAAPWRPAMNPGSPVLAAPPSPIPRTDAAVPPPEDHFDHHVDENDDDDVSEPRASAPLASREHRKRERDHDGTDSLNSASGAAQPHRQRRGANSSAAQTPKATPRLHHAPHRSHHNWEPKAGELVGRGPGWSFKDQGTRCDYGVVVDVFREEVLVRWRVSADHVAIVGLLQHVPGLGPEDRLFRYRFTGAQPEVVSWPAFLRARTLQPANVSVKLEELLLMGAILGVLCNQKDCVLPCFQYQTVECMLALVDVQVVAAQEKYATLLSELQTESVEYRAACAAVDAASAPGADGTPPVPANVKAAEKRKKEAEMHVLENILPFNAALSAVEAHFRSQRELAARGLWVLNSLLQHKKLAMVFLERNGLDRVLEIGQATTITTIMYGCSLIISQLARPAVLEEVLQRHTHLFTHTMSFAMKCMGHPCADIKGSAAAFYFHALNFPLVLMHFDANGGLTAALRLLDEVVATNDATHDVVNPTLCLVMLRGFGTYLNAHMLLQTRVLFAEHRSLAAVLHRPATSALPTRDVTTLEVVSTILTSPTETAMRYLTGVLPETFRRTTSSQNIHAYRALVEHGFHTSLLRCVIFYRDQDRYDLLNATLSLLKTFAAFPFTRKAIVLCDEHSGSTSSPEVRRQNSATPNANEEVALPQSAHQQTHTRGNSPSVHHNEEQEPPQIGAAAAAAREAAVTTPTTPTMVVRSVPTLLLVMEDLNASNKESVQAVVGALQILLLLLTPPRDSQDESGAVVFSKVCASVRSNDGIRVLLELLRPRHQHSSGTSGASSGGASMNAGSTGHHRGGQLSPTTLALFPVVAHVVHILVRLVSNPGSDTHLLFRALDVHRIVKDVLQMYMDVPRMFANKVVMHRHDVPINVSLSQFVEHAKCLVMGHLPSLMHTHSTSFHHHQEPLTLAGLDGDDAAQQNTGQRLSANLRQNHNNATNASNGSGALTPTTSSASGPQFEVDEHTRRRGGSPSPQNIHHNHHAPGGSRSDNQPFYPTYRAHAAAANEAAAREGGLGVVSAAPGVKDSSELLSDPFEVMERQEIVNRSTLEFTRPSLLKLITSYLESEGLTHAAEAVKEDALRLAENVDKADDAKGTEMSSVAGGIVSLPAQSATTTAAEQQTLPGLVKSYLRFHQSAYASHPIATLPPFDLTGGVTSSMYAKVTDVTRRRVGAARNAITRTLKRNESIHAFRRCRAYDHNTFYDNHRFLFDVRGANDDELSALSITFCDDGATIAIGTSEGGIALFDTSSGEDINGSGEKLLEQHIVFEDGGVVDVVASPNQQLLAAVRDLSGTADGGGSMTQLMRRDALPISILSIADCRTVRYAEHHDNLLVATMDTASKCILYDLNRVDTVQVFTDSDMSFSASENFKNVANLDATGNLVLSDATLWDRRCSTKPLFHFDRITEHFTGCFHPNNRHVIIDKSVWDLRTLTMLLSCPALHQTIVHSFDYGSRLAAFQEPDYSRSSSIVTIIDGQTYETARTLDMKPLLRSFAVSKTGVLFAGIQDSDTEVSVRIYSFGMEADEERYVAESEEPVDEDDLDGSDSELDMEDDDLDEAEDVSSSSLYSSNGEVQDDESDEDEGDDDEEDDDSDDDDEDSSEDEVAPSRNSSRRLSAVSGPRASGPGPSSHSASAGGVGSHPTGEAETLSDGEMST